MHRARPDVCGDEAATRRPPDLATLRAYVREVGSKAEWDRPQVVLMHAPGEEVILGTLHPPAALFEKPFSATAAAGEHAKYRALLQGKGAKIVLVEDVLLAGTLDEHGKRIPGPELDALRALALRSVKVDTSALGPGAEAEQQKVVQDAIKALDPRELAYVLMNRPTIRLSRTEQNTGYAAQYEVEPVTNLYFMRDQMITTAKGVVLGAMNSVQRAPETQIAKFVLEKLGIEPIYEVGGADKLEGGDFIPAGDIAFQGQGLRTSAGAVNRLLERQVYGTPRVAVVRESWHNQDQMHLDTYFNVLGPKDCVLVDSRINAPPGDKMHLTVDVFELDPEGYKPAIEGKSFVDYLRDDLGYTITPVPAADQLKYGVNFLTVGEKQALGVDGVSEEYKRRLQDAGIQVTWMNFTNLKSGYGAAHCTSQVLRRLPVHAGGDKAADGAPA